MNAFDSEVRERKRLVSSARHKKNGSKSKRCSLPSDHLTERQWKARCGEIMEYKLSSPVPWAEFKRYPRDIQEMYIQNMVDLQCLCGPFPSTSTDHSIRRWCSIPSPLFSTTERGSLFISPVRFLKMRRDSCEHDEGRNHQVV